MLDDWSKGNSASRVQWRILASAHSSPGSSQEGLTERIRRSHWPILFAVLWQGTVPYSTVEIKKFKYPVTKSEIATQEWSGELASPTLRTKAILLHAEQWCLRRTRGCIFPPVLFSPLKFDATRAGANGVYYLDKCIFHPVMFSPP
jgi:hypothetical protein